MRVWRGRVSGLAGPPILAGATLALSLGAAALLGATSAGPSAADWLLVGRLPAGDVVLSVPLPDDSFALRYRNSLYGSLAEERFTIDARGRLVLEELASDEAALLGEYYEIGQRPYRAPLWDARDWVAPPATQTALQELPVLATLRGQRSLIVEGRAPIALWSLAGSERATVTLVAEKAP